MSLREKVTAALRKVGFFNRAKRIAARRKAVFKARIEEATHEIEQQEIWLAKNRKDASITQLQHHEAKLAAAHRRRGRLVEKARAWRKRYIWARNREDFWEELLASRRRKLGEKKIDAADFENSMTGSHEWWTLTPAAKAAIAIGIEVFGLWVSSTYRPETPGSHHAEDPTRGGDLAGEWDNMVRYQRWLYENHLGALLELYGPDNGLCADNGVPAPQAEGTFNENLHDSHDHVFLSDPNYPLAYPAR